MTYIVVMLLLGLVLEQTRIWSIIGLFLLGSYLAYPTQTLTAAAVLSGIYLFANR